MIRAIVIDDETLARKLLIEYIRKSKHQFEILAEANDGFDGIKKIQDLNPDLIFLDVQMPKINGFEMLEVLDDDKKPGVIFTTAFDEYALQAFDAAAVDYLLKPFSFERFEEAIDKWVKYYEREEDATKESIANINPDEQNRIVVKEGGIIKVLSLDDIVHIEAYDDYVQIHTEGNTFLKKKTLTHYEKIFEVRGFVRVHRSHLIPIAQVNKIEKGEKDSYICILRNGSRVPVSRNGYVKLKNTLR